MTPWRNGSASDFRSEGCVFESRRGQVNIFLSQKLELYKPGLDLVLKRFILCDYHSHLSEY